jgi:hypothetical protein
MGSHFITSDSVTQEGVMFPIIQVKGQFQMSKHYAYTVL